MNTHSVIQDMNQSVKYLDEYSEEYLADRTTVRDKVFTVILIIGIFACIIGISNHLCSRSMIMYYFLAFNGGMIIIAFYSICHCILFKWHGLVISIAMVVLWMIVNIPVYMLFPNALFIFSPLLFVLVIMDLIYDCMLGVRKKVMDVLLIGPIVTYIIIYRSIIDANFKLAGEREMEDRDPLISVYR